MLVSTHKHLLIACLFLVFTVGLNPVKAQVWTLDQCIDSAQVYNKTLQINRNRQFAAFEKIKEMKAGLIPKLTATADYKYFTNLPYQLMPMSTFNPSAPEGQFKEAQFGVPHTINASIQLTMPLYNSQIYGAIETAGVASELSELQFQKTEEQLFFEISNLYYNAQILGRQLDFIEGNLGAVEKLLRNMELLHENLLTKGSDVSKVRLQQTQLNTQKLTINSKYEQVLNALKFSMGVPIEQKVLVEPDIAYQLKNEPSYQLTIDEQLIQTQNRLLLTELKTLGQSRFLPSINLIGSYGTSGFGYDKKPNDFLKFYPIGFAGLQFSLSIFNGTVTQRKINQKRLEVRNNELQLDLIVEQNELQVANVRQQKTVAQSNVETNLQQIQLAQTVYEQSILQQKEGTASLTEVLLSDNDLRQAQQDYLSAIVDYLKADLELKKLTGNLKHLRNSNL